MKKHLIGTINNVEIYKPNKTSELIEIRGIIKLLNLRFGKQLFKLMKHQDVEPEISIKEDIFIPYWECLVWIGSTASDDFNLKQNIVSFIIEHFITKPKMFQKRKLDFEKSKTLFYRTQINNYALLETTNVIEKLKEDVLHIEKYSFEEFIRDRTQSNIFDSTA